MRLVHARFNVSIQGVPALSIRQVDPDDPEVQRLVAGEILTLLEEPREVEEPKPKRRR